MGPSPLPPSLGYSFLVSDARDHGIDRPRLRRRDLTRPFHGVRVRSDGHAPDTHDRHGRELGDRERAHLARVRAYEPLLTDGRFLSHVTAAVAWGTQLPSHVIRDVVHVAVSAPNRLPRGSGVRGHQVRPTMATWRIDGFTGLALAGPATTWAMLGAVLKDPYDLVAAGDSLVREWRVVNPLASIEDLERVAARGRWAGITALRAALPRIRTGSASRPETHQRLLLIDRGLPEPALNVEIWESGVFLGTVDAILPGLKIALEYEGDHHRLDPKQWSYDIGRYDRMREAGWIVIRVTRDDLFAHPERVVARVRAAIASRA